MRSIYQIWKDSGLFKEYDKTGHATYSPSKFHQYANCPYSAKFEKIKGDKPKRDEAAAIGTAAHDIASTKLIHGKESSEVAEKLLHYAEDGMNAKQMNDDANDYVDFIRSQIGDYSIVRVEEMLDMSPWIDGVFGTCDCLIFDPNTLTVIDYKYGLKSVEAENNEQLIAYAVGAMIAMDNRARPKNINLIIYQPRTKGETVKVWTINYDQLLIKAHDIKKQIKKIDKATLSDRYAGNWCEYCGNRICPVKIQHIAEMLQVDTAKEFLTDGEIYGLQAVKRNVNRLLQNFENDVLQLYAEGEIMQDYEMTYTNGRKTWNDEEKVKQILTDNNMLDALTTPSPAQLERKYPTFFQEMGLNDYVNQTKKKNGFNLH